MEWKKAMQSVVKNFTDARFNIQERWKWSQYPTVPSSVLFEGVKGPTPITIPVRVEVPGSAEKEEFEKKVFDQLANAPELNPSASREAFAEAKLRASRGMYEKSDSEDQDEEDEDEDVVVHPIIQDYAPSKRPRINAALQRKLQA
jgi:hypothetical protein